MYRTGRNAGRRIFYFPIEPSYWGMTDRGANGVGNLNFKVSDTEFIVVIK